MLLELTRLYLSSADMSRLSEAVLAVIVFYLALLGELTNQTALRYNPAPNQPFHELSPRFKRHLNASQPPNKTEELIQNIKTSLKITFQGLVDLGNNEEIQAIYLENARLHREDMIVDKALMVIAIAASVVIVVGLAWYAKMGYCTTDL